MSNNQIVIVLSLILALMIAFMIVRAIRNDRKKRIHPADKKRMQIDRIIGRLEEYLPDNLIQVLETTSFLPFGSAVICAAISMVIRDYRDTQERENQVGYLLSMMLRIHFSEVDSSFPDKHIEKLQNEFNEKFFS